MQLLGKLNRRQRDSEGTWHSRKLWWLLTADVVPKPPNFYSPLILTVDFLFQSRKTAAVVDGPCGKFFFITHHCNRLIQLFLIKNIESAVETSNFYPAALALSHPLTADLILIFTGIVTSVYKSLRNFCVIWDHCHVKPVSSISEQTIFKCHTHANTDTLKVCYTFAFQRQKWLPERASMLPYMCISSLVWYRKINLEVI